MIEVDEAEKTLKFFQYNQICLSDDSYHFVGVYLNIYYRNDQIKIFDLNDIKFIFVDIDYKVDNI